MSHRWYGRPLDLQQLRTATVADLWPPTWSPPLLTTSAHRVGLSDQPGWLTIGVWLDLIEALEPGRLRVQILTTGGQAEAPVWGHIRLVAQPRAHVWHAWVRRPGATAAVKLDPVDTAELPQLVNSLEAAWRADDDTVWNGEPWRPEPPAGATAVEWEGFADEAGGFRFGFFRSQGATAAQLLDLVDLAWNAHLPRAWVLPGPTLLFRGIPQDQRGAWQSWCLRQGLVTRRGPFDAAITLWGDPRVLASARARLRGLLEQHDRLPVAGAVVLAEPVLARTDGVFCPGWPLVVSEGDHWLWRSPDQRWSGEGDDDALVQFLFETPRVCEPPRSEAAPRGTACGDCLNVYSPAWGDPLGGVAPGVAFDALPAHWRCPVCGAPREHYLTTSASTGVAPAASSRNGGRP